MTVETQKNKTDPQIMGSSLVYSFGFRVRLEDPTEDDAKQAIKVAVFDGTTEQILTYGTDYTVELDKSGHGGTVTVVDKKTSNCNLVVYREYTIKQGSDYKDYDSFPAETLEGDIDKHTMILQQLKEEIGRCIKTGIVGDIDPDVLRQQVVRVYASVDNIDTVSKDISSVKTAASNIGNINTVAENISNVNSVGKNINNVNIVAANIGNVNVCASNIEAIKDAPNQANIAKTSATNAVNQAAAAKGYALAAAADGEEIKETLEILSYGEIMGGYAGESTSNELFGGSAGDGVNDEIIGGNY